MPESTTGDSMKAYCPECKALVDVAVRHVQDPYPAGTLDKFTDIVCERAAHIVVTFAEHLHFASAAQVPAEPQPIHPTDSAE